MEARKHNTRYRKNMCVEFDPVSFAIVRAGAQHRRRTLRVASGRDYDNDERHVAAFLSAADARHYGALNAKHGVDLSWLLVAAFIETFWRARDYI